MTSNMYIDAGYHKVVLSSYLLLLYKHKLRHFPVTCADSVEPGRRRNSRIHGFTDSRIHGCVAHRSEGDERGFAGVCGGLRGFARPEAQQPGSKLKAQDNPRIL